MLQRTSRSSSDDGAIDAKKTNAPTLTVSRLSAMPFSQLEKNSYQLASLHTMSP